MIPLLPAAPVISAKSHFFINLSGQFQPPLAIFANFLKSSGRVCSSHVFALYVAIFRRRQSQRPSQSMQTNFPQITPPGPLMEYVIYGTVSVSVKDQPARWINAKNNCQLENN